MEKLELQKIANEVRKDIVTALHSAKAGHPGGSLSAADVFTYLYFEEMNIDPKDPKKADRDRFVLSKGHTAPGYYSALAERGFFPKEDLKTLRHLGSYLQGHPDMKHIPGVDMSSGSLGQGISAAVGMALSAKLSNESYRVYTLLGDGEIQEGQVWEAAMFAGARKLDNLVVIVDNNGMPTIDASKKEIVGTSTPNFLMGFNTHFTWKGITLSAVLDWRNGGEFYSYTSQLLTFAGNSTYTVFNNREPFVVPNSVKVVNGQYVENDIPIVHWGGASSAVNTYYNNASNYAQYRNWILPKDYLKLREITLSYSLPKAWLKQTPFSMVQVSLIGRNLFMWTPKKNNYVDPEGTNYGNDILSEIGEFGAAPTNRTFGGGIKVVL